MAVTQYIGARYVPLFADPAEWDKTRTYEPLTIVLHEGNSYTSRQYVPVGIDINNTDFWLETGNYNAQVERYRQEVLEVDSKMDDVNDAISDVNTKLEELENVNIEHYLQDLVFAPYTRTILQNDNDVYTSFQVSTMDESEQFIYVITPFSSSDQATTKTSTLNVINPQTGEIIASKILDVGHGRSLTIKNNIMLTSNQYAEANNEWVAIDITNKINPILVSRGNFNGRHIFWTDDGAACYTGQNTIKFFDVSYDVNGYPIKFTENGKSINFSLGIRGEEQSFQYWNGYIVISSTLPESIIIINAKTGKEVAYTSLEESYGFLRTAECESAFIVNNHIYFSNNSRVPPTADGITNLEFSLFRCDFLDPKGEWYDFWLQKTYQSSRGGPLYVSGVRPSASSVSSDGGQNSPYWFVEDALLSYTTKKRMHYSGNVLLKYLSLTFTRSEYKYRIYISNVNEWFMAINGYGDSKTTVPCVFAFNANVMLNRIIFSGCLDQALTTSTYPVSIFASKSKIRGLATLEFTNEVANNVDVFADYMSECVLEGDIRRAIAYRGSKINARTVTRWAGATGGEVVTTNVATNSNATGISIGATSSSRWINLVLTDKSMYRLFIENGRLRLEYYPDASVTDTHNTVWTIPATVA